MPGHSQDEDENTQHSFKDMACNPPENTVTMHDVGSYTTTYDVTSEQNPYNGNGSGYVADTSSPESSQFEPNNISPYEKAPEFYSFSAYNMSCHNPQEQSEAMSGCERRHSSTQGMFDSTGPRPKTSKRKRIITFDQRKAANIRERRRMMSLNDAFDILRRSLPTFSYEKKLSRIETLRLALTYIAFMTDVLNGVKPKDVKLLPLKTPTLGRGDEVEGPVYPYYM